MKKSQEFRAWEAFASPHRLRILRLLLEDEIGQGDFKWLFGWPQSTTARHLLYLEKKGFINSRKEGLRRYYRVESPSNRLIAILFRAVKEGMGQNDMIKRDLRKFKRIKSRLKRPGWKKRFGTEG